MPFLTTAPFESFNDRLGTGKARFPLKGLALVILAGLFINLLPIATPGFYSHDELDWQNRIARNDYPWSFGMGSFAESPFFRLLGASFVSLSLRVPLQPFASHFVEVALSIATACLVHATVAQFRPDRAASVAILFMLMPGFAYSTGWIAAEYDIQYALLGSLATLCAIRYWRGGRTSYLIASLSTFLVALGCKETALSIPVCAALVAFIDRERVDRRRFAILVAGAAAIVAVYLGLSAGRIVRMGQSGGGGYRTGGGARMLSNAAAYFGFPFTSGMMEIGSSPIEALVKAITRLGPHLFLVALIVWRGGPNWALLYVLGYFATLLPVLPISKHETQYTYASSIALALALALVWDRRLVVALPVLALLAILAQHAIAIQVGMYQTGVCQARALQTLEAILPDLPPSRPLAILIADDTPWPVISRALHDNSFPLRGELVTVTATRDPAEAGMLFHEDCGVSLAAGP